MRTCWQLTCVLGAALLGLGAADCGGGKGGVTHYSEGSGGAEKIFDFQVTSHKQTGSQDLICTLNMCHALQFTFGRIDIQAGPNTTIACQGGGSGSYWFQMSVTGPTSRTFTATMWGDWHQSKPPNLYNKYSWNCKIPSLFQGQDKCP